MTEVAALPQSFHRDVPPDRMETSLYSTRSLPPRAQLLAWRTRVGHAVDVPPAKKQLADGFGADIDRYAVDGLSFTDCRSDEIVLERSVARISTDKLRDYAFHLYTEGGVGNVTGMRKKRSANDAQQRIIAMDMNQPFRVERPACRVLSLFVPDRIVGEELPDRESFHGRVVRQGSPFAGLLMDHVVAIASEIPQLDAVGAAEALSAAAKLLLAAVRNESSLMGADRAALQVAVMGQIRRFVEANLHQSDLSPTMVVQALKLKRATVYRWFEHEGGLGAYIRHRRLRMAADELVRYPNLAAVEIAYGLGFKSASDFTRAFRRAFDMTPQEMRSRAFALQRTRPRT